MSKKINILSPGRFHVCDLARELDKQRWDVKFYSFVPTVRSSKFGLPARCSRPVWLAVLPFLFLTRLFPKSRWLMKRFILWQDFFTAVYMRKCDVLIAMSGNYVYSLKKAKKQGAIVVLERGSKHILAQKSILEAIPSLKGKKPIPDINVARELEGYKLADHISIASEHVKESFQEYSYPLKKLFVNPYGVDLSMFRVFSDFPKQYDLIMVGGWSFRKGCDLIIEAITQLNLTLLHVGPVIDCEFPQGRSFTHVPPVDQRQLEYYYNQAKAFVLPSREEGLAMVQMQAISCNLPVVCSKHSGGEDLKKFFPKRNAIFVIDKLSVDSLIASIQEALTYTNKEEHLFYDMNGIEQLTWEAYGKRYSKFLKEIIS